MEKKETVQAEPLCPYKDLTLPCSFGKPRVPGEVRDRWSLYHEVPCSMSLKFPREWFSGKEQRVLSHPLSTPHLGILGSFLSRLRPLTSSLNRLLFWLAGVLPEGQLWSPRHCLSVRVLNLTLRNSFSFSLCSRHVS